LLRTAIAVALTYEPGTIEISQADRLSLINADPTSASKEGEAHTSPP
jgi:hypothetical protein